MRRIRSYPDLPATRELQQQMNPAEIAEQLGHSLQMLFSTYAHVIEELRGQRAKPAETVIAAARKAPSDAHKERTTTQRRSTIKAAGKTKTVSVHLLWLAGREGPVSACRARV